MVFNRLLGKIRQRHAAIAAVLIAAALSGCHGDMWNQPRYKAFSRNDAYANHMAMRLPVEGTFAYDGARREWLHPLYEKLTGQVTVPSKADEVFYTGKQPGADGKPEPVATNYFQQITPELLARGKERFEITCAACHGYTGEGGGIIVQRGFPQAVSFHIDRLREVNDGYIYDVITNGFGRMYSYAARVAPEDRWAIIAYVRALQYSQDVDITDPNSDVTKMVLAGIAEQEAADAAAAAAHGAHGEGHGEAHGAEPAHGEPAGGMHEEPGQRFDTNVAVPGSAGIAEPGMESHAPESGAAQAGEGHPATGTLSGDNTSPSTGVPAHAGSGSPEESEDEQHSAGDENEQPLKQGSDPTQNDSEQQ